MASNRVGSDVPKLVAVIIVGAFFSVATGFLAWGALVAGDRWGILQKILVLSMSASALVGVWSLLGSRFLHVWFAAGAESITDRLDQIQRSAWIITAACTFVLAILAALGVLGR